MSITANNTHDIRCNNKQGNNINKNPKYYLSNPFQKPFPSIKFYNTSTTEIEKMINSIKIKESSGYDEISTKILKTTAPFISSPLNYIWNKSILSGTFPTQKQFCAVLMWTFPCLGRIFDLWIQSKCITFKLMGN